MTVQEIVSGGVRYSLTGVGYAPAGQIQEGGSSADPAANRALQELLKAGMLCNDSNIIKTDQGWQVEGDPTHEGRL
jgi:Ca2+-transporting ATPase